MDVKSTLEKQKKRRETEIVDRQHEYELAVRRSEHHEKWEFIFTFLTEKAAELPPHSIHVELARPIFLAAHDIKLLGYENELVSNRDKLVSMLDFDPTCVAFDYPVSYVADQLKLVHWMLTALNGNVDSVAEAIGEYGPFEGSPATAIDHLKFDLAHSDERNPFLKFKPRSRSEIETEFERLELLIEAIEVESAQLEKKIVCSLLSFAGTKSKGLAVRWYNWALKYHEDEELTSWLQLLAESLGKIECKKLAGGKAVKQLRFLKNKIEPKLLALFPVEQSKPKNQVEAAIESLRLESLFEIANVPVIAYRWIDAGCPLEDQSRVERVVESFADLESSSNGILAMIRNLIDLHQLSLQDSSDGKAPPQKATRKPKSGRPAKYPPTVAKACKDIVNDFKQQESRQRCNNRDIGNHALNSNKPIPELITKTFKDLTKIAPQELGKIIREAAKCPIG